VNDHNSGVRVNLQFITTMLIAELAILLAAVTVVVGRTIRQRQQALAHAQQINARQQATFDDAVDGILLLDEDANILKLTLASSACSATPKTNCLGSATRSRWTRAFSLSVWVVAAGAEVVGAFLRLEDVDQLAD